MRSSSSTGGVASARCSSGRSPPAGEPSGYSPEETQLAVYAFPDEVDVEQPLTLEYGFETASGWDEILRRLETELGRARTRAGLGR